jgi:hypothetical protein
MQGASLTSARLDIALDHASRMLIPNKGAVPANDKSIGFKRLVMKRLPVFDYSQPLTWP